jgi:geranylgeranyl diphosphate synthase type II
LGKWTYPGLVGKQQSRQLARTCIESAQAAVQPLGSAGESLRVLAEFVIERDH